VNPVSLEELAPALLSVDEDDGVTNAEAGFGEAFGGLDDAVAAVTRSSMTSTVWPDSCSPSMRLAFAVARMQVDERHRAASEKAVARCSPRRERRRRAETGDLGIEHALPRLDLGA